MNDQKNIIGVDLGGTNIRAGKIINSEIVKVSKLVTPSNCTEQEVTDKLIETIEACFDNNTICIGVGVPSVVDVANGIVYDVVNIPSWKVVPLKDILYKRFQVPVFINNDSNCFAAGEKIYGKGKDYQHIVGMTIGTGLGLGLIINGNLYEGRNCGAGEFGMVPYLDDVFETYCSGQFFSNIKKMNAAELHMKAHQGNKEALAIFEEFGKHVGIAMKSILYAYDPEITIIGGSLSNAFDLFKGTMYKEIETFAYRNTLKNLKIEVSEVTDSAILGAAALHMGTLSIENY
jgi:glucokinase